MNTLYFICGLSLGFSLCGWIVSVVLLWKIKWHIRAGAALALQNKYLHDQLQLANKMIDRLEGQIDEDEPSDLGLN